MVVVLTLIVILTFAWCWHLFLNWCEWKLIERRCWREIRKRIE